MSGTLNFNRSYLDFGTQVRAVEKTADVIAVYEEVLTMFAYDVGDQIGAPFTAQWLGEGERPENDPDKLDLIFEIQGEPFFEIILNGHGEDARYGGWLFGQKPVVVSDEIVDGYRVLLTTLSDGTQLRHEYNSASESYDPAASVAAVPLIAARRMGLRRAS